MTVVAGWPQEFGLRHHNVLDSTNREARRLANSGERGPLWIVARRQFAGQGRYGREWISEEGNLFATLLAAGSPPMSAQMGFVAGVSVADVIGQYVPRQSVRLKWPNDVLIGGGKAAGILVEQVSADLVAAGIGIDLAHCPLGIGAASVAVISGFAPDPDEVMAALAQSMKRWLSTWREQGFDSIRSAWTERAGGIGEPIRVVTPQARFDGVFEGLDRDGALLLREGSSAARRITAADVFYGA